MLTDRCPEETLGSLDSPTSECRVKFFPGFQAVDITLEGCIIHAVVGGADPPLLLLHGYPQTHVCWHKVAPKLAERFTVVAADLRGYADSSKPEGGANHANYSNRQTAKTVGPA